MNWRRGLLLAGHNVAIASASSNLSLQDTHIAWQSTLHRLRRLS